MIYDSLEQLKKDLGKEGRIMALDVGTKTIGIAISDATRVISTPKGVIKRQGGKTDFAIIQKLSEENKISAIIIGLPLNMDGSESKITKLVKTFCQNLDNFLKTQKLIYIDERLSTFEADEFITEFKMKKSRGQLVDQIAASMILQSFLDLLRT